MYIINKQNIIIIIRYLQTYKILQNETSEQYFTSLHDEKKVTNNTIMNGKCHWVGI
jgi:hypothetical protein